MCPYLFGVLDSYTVMMILGMVLAFVIAVIYFKKKHLTKNQILDIVICGCLAIIVGLIFAVLFENLYELFQSKEPHWTWGLTFFGGLLGGVFGFLLIYAIFYRKSKAFPIEEVVTIAPLCITSAHMLGRIGCFLSGCCYGKPTDSWIGITFPNIGKVIPTQLIEAAFLLVLSIVLTILIFKYDYKYSFVIYFAIYSIGRFIIEFFRGDDRGAFLGPFSPSQVWCIVFFLLAIPLYFFLRKRVFYEQKQVD